MVSTGNYAHKQRMQGMNASTEYVSPQGWLLIYCGTFACTNIIVTNIGYITLQPHTCNLVYFDTPNKLQSEHKGYGAEDLQKDNIREPI